MEIRATLQVMRSITYSGTVYWVGPNPRRDMASRHSISGCSGFYHGQFQNLIGSPKAFSGVSSFALLIHVASENGGQPKVN